jgi:hypothetical protein
MIIWILAGVILLITLSLLVFFVPTLGIKEEQTYGPWTLGTKDATLDSTVVTTFLGNLNSTLRVFYYIKSIPRTSTSFSYAQDVAPNFNSKTNTFDVCVNTNGACVHQGFIPLLKLGDSLMIEMLQAPDASRPGLPKTQLCIQTTRNTGASNTTYLETFALPPFPIQKWIMLSLVRRGNSFDVYYNDTLVASHRTLYAPNLLSTSGSFADGSVRGQTKYLMAKNTSQSASDVNSDYMRLANPKGEPYEPMFPALNLPMFCPSGDCFQGPQVRPANPLVDWRTNYM